MNGRFRFFQSGFSLIELSIATTIFSMGLGSLSLMMLAAIHGTAEARHQTVATMQASSLEHGFLADPAKQRVTGWRGVGLPGQHA